MIGRPRGRVVALAVALAMVVFGCLAAQADAFVYWTNASGGTVGRANLDGSGADQMLITGASAPEEMAVNGQHVYWANAAAARSGGRTWMARSSTRASSPAEQPSGLAVDGQHVYWTNLSSGAIGRANLDGRASMRASSPARTSRTGWRSTASTSTGPTSTPARSAGESRRSGVDQSFITGANDPDGVAVDGQHVYWSNRTLHLRAGELDGPASTRASSPGRTPNWGGGRRPARLLDQPTRRHGRAGETRRSGVDQSFITGANIPEGVAVDALPRAVGVDRAPVSGATYALGQVVATSFSCPEGTGGPGWRRGPIQGRRAPAGADTSTSVRKVDGHRDQQGRSARNGEHLLHGRGATVGVDRVPVNGASYALGRAALSSFSCSEGSFGPGWPRGDQGSTPLLPRPGTSRPRAGIPYRHRGQHRRSDRDCEHRLHGCGAPDRVDHDPAAAGVVSPRAGGGCELRLPGGGGRPGPGLWSRSKRPRLGRPDRHRGRPSGRTRSQ